jgi:hypothetical protein
LDQCLAQYFSGVPELAPQFGFSRRNAAVVNAGRTQDFAQFLSDVAIIMMQLTQLITRCVNQVAQRSFLRWACVERAHQAAQAEKPVPVVLPGGKHTRNQQQHRSKQNMPTP